MCHALQRDPIHFGMNPIALMDASRSNLYEHKSWVRVTYRTWRTHEYFRKKRVGRNAFIFNTLYTDKGGNNIKVVTQMHSNSNMRHTHKSNIVLQNSNKWSVIHVIGFFRLTESRNCSLESNKEPIFLDPIILISVRVLSFFSSV